MKTDKEMIELLYTIRHELGDELLILNQALPGNTTLSIFQDRSDITWNFDPRTTDKQLQLLACGFLIEVFRELDNRNEPPF